MLAVLRRGDDTAPANLITSGFSLEPKLVSFSESPRGMVQDVLEGTARRRPCATGAHIIIDRSSKYRGSPSAQQRTSRAEPLAA